MSLEDIAIPIVIVAGMLFLGSIVYCGYVEDAAETIVVHDGNQSYACEVNRINKTPHDCKPIITPTATAA